MLVHVLILKLYASVTITGLSVKIEIEGRNKKVEGVLGGLAYYI